MRRALSILVLALATSLSCKARPADIVAWETEDDGPEKLAAVVREESQPRELRVDAALALTRITRNKRHVGVDLASSAIAALPPGERATYTRELATALALTLEQPQRRGEEALGAKDLAYLIVARDQLSDAGSRDALLDALAAWLAVDPTQRVDQTGQEYGSFALFALLGPRFATLLPKLLANDSARSGAVEYVRASKDEPLRAQMLAALQLLVKKEESPSWRRSSIFSSMRGLPGATKALLDVVEEPFAAPVDQAAAISALRAADLTAADVDRIFSLIAKSSSRQLYEAWFPLVVSMTDVDVRLDAMLANGDDASKFFALSVFAERVTPDTLERFMKKIPADLTRMYDRMIGTRLIGKVGRVRLSAYLTQGPERARELAAESLRIERLPTAR